MNNKVYIIMGETNSYETIMTSPVEVYKSERLANARLKFLNERASELSGDGVTISYDLIEMEVQDD